MLMNRMLEQMDRLFGPIGFDGAARMAPPYPPLSVWGDDDHLYVEAELPGLTREDLDVAVAEGDQLTIAGVRKPCGPENGSWLRQECWYGRFSRTVTLPTAVNPDAVEARYEAGVLSLTLPKSEAAKPKRIAVKGAGPAALSSAEE
jgi:HSP20 family protein